MWDFFKALENLFNKIIQLIPCRHRFRFNVYKIKFNVVLDLGFILSLNPTENFMSCKIKFKEIWNQYVFQHRKLDNPSIPNSIELQSWEHMGKHIWWTNLNILTKVLLVAFKENITFYPQAWQSIRVFNIRCLSGVRTLFILLTTKASLNLKWRHGSLHAFWINAWPHLLQMRNCIRRNVWSKSWL